MISNALFSQWLSVCCCSNILRVVRGHSLKHRRTLVCSSQIAGCGVGVNDVSRGEAHEERPTKHT